MLTVPGTTPTCGNGVIEEGEECEVGGVGCDPETCKCTEEFVPASPAATDCLKRNRCGDGVLVVEEGEECEAGGLGCSSECKCLPGYIAASSVDCTADDDVPLKDICESLTESPDDSGYVCLSEDSGEYLRCHLTEKVATMMACAAGTRCKAPVGVFQVYNPCLWESYSEYPEIFQHGSSSEAQKQHRKARSDDDNDDDSSAYVPVNHNYSVYCKLFGKAGYYCARQINPQARSDEFVYCDTNGNYAYQLTCAKGSYCALDGFSEENPCTGRSHLSSDSDEATCGNGVLEAGEECEAGAFGCDEEICECKHGFFPSADLDGSCFCKKKIIISKCTSFAVRLQITKRTLLQ